MPGRRSLFSRPAALACLVLGAVALLCLAAPLPAPAEAARQDADQLQVILDGWAEAIGGRERLARVATQHRRVTTTMFGMTGTVEEWLTADGCHRLDLDLGGIFKITVVKSQQASWLLDQNGKVSEQAGRDLADEISTVYLETWSHLLPGRMAGELEYLGAEPETGLHIIACRPAGGIEIVIYVDPVSFLPVRTEQPFHGGDTLTVSIGDWRDFDGVLLPGTVKQSMGVPQNDVLATLEEVVFGAEPGPDTFARPGEAADDIQFTAGNAARDIPLDLNGVHIFLQGGLNDSEPLWFLLDTGASVTAIDTEVARELGFELTGKVMGGGAGEGRAEVNFIKGASFSVPGVQVTGQTVATLALGRLLESRLGRRIDGILGYDFISRFVVEIDYAGALLHLHDRRDFAYEGDGEVVPIRLVSNHPHCDAKIGVRGRESIPCDLLIDTGAGLALSFSRPFTEEHDLLATLDRKVFYSGGFGIGGVSKSYFGRIEGLSLGALEFTTPVCSFSQDERGAGAEVTTAGLLGGLILEQCTVIFDYERLRMILEPNERYGSSIAMDMSGLSFDTGGRDDWHLFTVRHVIAGSAADEAGIAVGDVIVSVDGRPAGEFTARDLRQMFQEEGRRVELVVRRGEQELNRTLKLKPLV